MGRRSNGPARAGNNADNIRTGIDIEATSTLLYAFLFIAQFATGMYTALGLGLPVLFVVLYPVITSVLVRQWLKEDCLRIGRVWPLRLGVFLFVLWPVVAPYYLFITRGPKGLAGVAIFVAALVAGWIAAMIAAPFFAN